MWQIISNMKLCMVICFLHIIPLYPKTFTNRLIKLWETHNQCSTNPLPQCWVETIILFSIPNSAISAIIFYFDPICGAFVISHSFTAFLLNHYITFLFVINYICQAFQSIVANFIVIWDKITLSCPAQFLSNLHILHLISNGIVENFDSKINLKTLSTMICFLLLSAIISPNNRHYEKKNHIEFVKYPIQHLKYTSWDNS